MPSKTLIISSFFMVIYSRNITISWHRIFVFSQSNGLVTSVYPNIDKSGFRYPNFTKTLLLKKGRGTL